MSMMSRRRGKKSEGKSERPRGKQTAGVSGGHLRLGHFVPSPCSVFSVVRRREEATYALVGSSRLRVALFYKRPSFLVISRVKQNWTRSLFTAKRTPSPSVLRLFAYLPRFLSVPFFLSSIPFFNYFGKNCQKSFVCLTMMKQFH